MLTPFFSVPVCLAKTSRRVSYQLVGQNSNGVSQGAREARLVLPAWCGLWVEQGALVRFSEEDAKGVANDNSA